MASSLSQFVLALISAALVLGLGTVVHRNPKLGVLAWLLTVAFVPIWLGFSFSIYFLPATLMGLFVLFAIIPAAPTRFGLFDLLAGSFFLCCLAPALAGAESLTLVVTIALTWILAFVLGRIVSVKVSLQWICAAIAVVFTVVAALAVVEFALHWNPFSGLGPGSALHLKWGPLQTRGNLNRSEGAFGHSIALGCSLAMAIPLALTAPFRAAVRLFMLLLMLAGVAATISRISMVCAALSIVLTVIFVPVGLSKRLRAGVLGLLVVAAGVLTPFVSTVFVAAGSEAANSASYRGSLTDLIPNIAVLGLSPVATTSATGDLYFGRFQSIDSQILFTGLTYGWFALFCGLALIVCGGIALLRRRVSAISVAVLAQVPALATVALITQYAMFFWFMVGLAVASQFVGTTRGDADIAQRHLPLLPVDGPGREWTGTPAQDADRNARDSTGVLLVR